MTSQHTIPQELADIRQSIDNIDSALILLVAERFKLTGRVGKLKAEHQLPATDPGREALQFERIKQLATGANLDPAFAEDLLKFIIAEVIKHHKAAQAE